MDYTSHFPLAANDWQKNGTSFYLKKVTDDWIVYFMADFTNLQLVYKTQAPTQSRKNTQHVYFCDEFSAQQRHIFSSYSFRKNLWMFFEKILVDLVPPLWMLSQPQFFVVRRRLYF